jgi:hypothetical protein
MRRTKECRVWQTLTFVRWTALFVSYLLGQTAWRGSSPQLIDSSVSGQLHGYLIGSVLQQRHEYLELFHRIPKC